MRNTHFLLGLFCACSFFFACTKKANTAESAQAKLTDEGEPFTRSAFNKAVTQGNVELLNLYLEGGMSPTMPDTISAVEDPYSSLSMSTYPAAKQNQVTILKLLQKAKFNINLRAAATLTFASTGGMVPGEVNGPYLIELIKDGILLNEVLSDESGTALHAAAFLCKVDAVKILVDAGASKSIKNGAGLTPKDVARLPETGAHKPCGPDVISLL